MEPPGFPVLAFYFRVLFEQRSRDSSCSSTKPSLRRDRVSAVLQAAEQNARNNPVKVSDIVRYLENRKWRVFHQLPKLLDHLLWRKTRFKW